MFSKTKGVRLWKGCSADVEIKCRCMTFPSPAAAGRLRMHSAFGEVWSRCEFESHPLSTRMNCLFKVSKVESFCVFKKVVVCNHKTIVLQNGRVGCCCDYLLLASIPPRRLVRGFIFIGSWVLLKSHLSHACHTYYPEQKKWGKL